MRRVVGTALGALAALAPPAAARPHAPATYALTPVGSFSQPVQAVAPAGDARLFVVERTGTVRVVTRSGVLPQPFLDVRASLPPLKGHNGLLSIAFDPAFAVNGLVYADFVDTSGNIRIQELHVAPGANRVDGSGRRVLSISHPPIRRHYGGQLQFGPDGLLYISVGDADAGARSSPVPWKAPQDLGLLLGKLLRIDPHVQPNAAPYGIPAGQPIRPGARSEIYASGLRNPWRFSFDRATGDLNLADAGDHAWEEVNFAASGHGLGANYGWECYEGPAPYAPHAGSSLCRRLQAAGTATRPVLAYDHSAGCVVIGGFTSRDPSLPGLEGRYLYGDFCSGTISSAVLAPSGATGDAPVPGLSLPTLSAFGEDGFGHLYAMDLAKVYRITTA